MHPLSSESELLPPAPPPAAGGGSPEPSAPSAASLPEGFSEPARAPGSSGGASSRSASVMPSESISRFRSRMISPADFCRALSRADFAAAASFFAMRHSSEICCRRTSGGTRALLRSLFLRSTSRGSAQRLSSKSSMASSGSVSELDPSYSSSTYRRIIALRAACSAVCFPPLSPPLSAGSSPRGVAAGSESGAVGGASASTSLGAPSALAPPPPAGTSGGRGSRCGGATRTLIVPLASFAPLKELEKRSGSSLVCKLKHSQSKAFSLLIFTGSRASNALSMSRG
mmetsp:Transcript_17849/g.42840  ORF Transcript_17849/g.42840 Transcript_17849/m.42840 type:complete len:285 (-) Transcript_17849:9-863(-)